MRVLAVTLNRYLGQKIYLALCDAADVHLSEQAETGYDVYFIDTDTIPILSFDNLGGRKITMGHSEGCNLSLPCSLYDLRSALSETDTAADLVLGDRCVYVKGEKIKLTELEYALLSMLIEARGDFVSREKILSAVWGEDVEPGIINVYVHYLREKLEKGEKIILAARNKGYRIDPRFLDTGNGGRQC